MSIPPFMKLDLNGLILKTLYVTVVIIVSFAGWNLSQFDNRIGSVEKQLFDTVLQHNFTNFGARLSALERSVDVVENQYASVRGFVTRHEQHSDRIDIALERIKLQLFKVKMHISDKEK